MAPDTWYRYTLTIRPANTANNDFDLRIQSLANDSMDASMTGLGFQNNVSNFSEVRFLYNKEGATGSTYSLDNILVTTDENDLNFAVIPEPSTLVLLIGGFLLLRHVKRWRWS